MLRTEENTEDFQKSCIPRSTPMNPSDTNFLFTGEGEGRSDRRNIFSGNIRGTWKGQRLFVPDFYLCLRLSLGISQNRISSL